jgi:hypothetical protein
MFGDLVLSHCGHSKMRGSCFAQGPLFIAGIAEVTTRLYGYRKDADRLGAAPLCQYSMFALEKYLPAH